MVQCARLGAECRDAEAVSFTDESARNRIAPVDGLRAIAAVGVLWAHVWAFTGNPQLRLGMVGPVVIDLNRLLAILGTGVDLFFVISGFCMYLMYARRQSRFSWCAYAYFVKRRWLRIAPAFYVAAIAAAVGHFVAGRAFPWLDLASHLSFTSILLPGMGGLSAPFWSLATEWHFYLILPLFIWASGRLGFWPTAAMAISSSIAYRAWIFPDPPNLELDWYAQLPARLVEFTWGICVARLYVDGTRLPRILSGCTGFLIGLTVAYLGRLLAVTEVVRSSAAAGPLLRMASEPVLTLGFAVILWNLVSSNSVFRRSLSHAIPQSIGRWSYSLYLWHWWPSVWICGLIVAAFGKSVTTQYLAFAAALAVIVPLAWLSYRLLEAPYFEQAGAKGPIRPQKPQEPA